MAMIKKLVGQTKRYYKIGNNNGKAAEKCFSL